MKRMNRSRVRKPSPGNLFATPPPECGQPPMPCLSPTDPWHWGMAKEFIYVGRMRGVKFLRECSEALDDGVLVVVVEDEIAGGPKVRGLARVLCEEHAPVVQGLISTIASKKIES